MMKEREKYKTLNGAKKFYKRLADQFYMAQEDKDRLEAAESIELIEHIWKDLINKL